jgi:shikimate kinase
VSGGFAGASYLDRTATLRLNLATIREAEDIMPRSESVSADKAEPPEAKVNRLLSGRTLVMVGMMGAGKSSVGRRLASRLGLPFVDADTEIERAANETITEIFERHGEAYFRHGERRVIQRLLDGKPKVLATGGGAFVNAETRAAIFESHAISIWLKADREVLMSRVRRRSNRPLLKTDNPEATMDRLIAERYPVYAEATLHIQSRDVAHDVVIDDILKALADHLERTPAEA